MGDKKKQADDDDTDYRAEFLFDYLTKSMKIKTDKWNKMYGSDECAKIILNFFNKPDQPRLIIIVNSAGQLQPVTDFPPSSKSKSCYFIRKKNVILTGSNIRDSLMFGDNSPKPTEEIASLVEDVFLPILNNPANQASWPKPIADNISKRVFAFKNKTYQIRGSLKGLTLLPMPSGIEKVYNASLALLEHGESSLDLELKSSFESIVLQWASVVNDVLQQSSELAFADGRQPTPNAEIEFWNSRSKIWIAFLTS